MPKIKNIPAFDSCTIILLRKRIYRCQSRGKRFYENIDFLPRYHRMASRLIFYILSQLASTSSFKSIAQLVNLSSSTVTRIFDKLSYSPFSLSKILAIDEFKGNTNPDEKHPIIMTLMRIKNAAIMSRFIPVKNFPMPII